MPSDPAGSWRSAASTIKSALFQRLAAASLGQPGALDGLPRGAEAAAALLVLREFMHHLGYRSLLVV